jgi:CdiI immunity protein
VQALKKTGKDDFPRLREFVRGYLHQDVLPVYGGPQAAAWAYLGDLNDGDRAELADETERMGRILTQGADVSTINEKLASLGARWKFETVGEFLSVWNILRDSQPRT